MLQQYTFYFVPAINIDGLIDISDAWSTFGRYFPKRKNNNPKYGDAKRCGHDQTNVGVDLNRNWGFAFYKDAIEYGKRVELDDPCAEDFQGPYPFSEPETRALRDFIMSRTNQLRYVANFHSFGNRLLKPFNSMKSDLL